MAQYEQKNVKNTTKSKNEDKCTCTKDKHDPNCKCGCNDDSKNNKCKCETNDQKQDGCGCGKNHDQSSNEETQDFILQITHENIDLKNHCKNLQAKLSDATDLARNYKADMDRMRERNKTFEQDKAIEVVIKVAENILPILDNFDNAFKNLKEDETTKGFRMIQTQMQELLNKFGIDKIPEQDEFDPLMHEAVTTIPCPDGEKTGSVAHYITSGYRFGEKLIRPAKVVLYS